MQVRFDRKKMLLCFTLITFIVVFGFSYQKCNNNFEQTLMAHVSQSPYTNLLSIMESGQDDAGSGGDAGNSSTFATFVVPGLYNGTLSSSEDHDYYKFFVPSGAIINVSMIPLNPAWNFDLTLYFQGEPFLQNLKGAGLLETIIWSSSISYNYTISIIPAIADYGNYTFSIQLTQQNDFNSGIDAGNSYDTSLIITEGASNGTLVKNGDKNDFYKIYIESGQIIDIFMETTSTTNIDIFFRDPNSILMDSSTKLVGLNESIYYAISETGFYTIQIEFVESTIDEIIVNYNLTVQLKKQNDANSGTDAGNTHENAYLIIPLRDSNFRGLVVWNGDRIDFYTFIIQDPTKIYAVLEVNALVNLGLKLYDESMELLYISDKEYPGATETITDKLLTNGTYFIAIEFISWKSGDPIESSYTLSIGLVIVSNFNETINAKELIMMIFSYGILPLFLIIIVILLLLVFTDVRIPFISKWYDKYLNKEGKGERIKSLKHAMKIRDDQITVLRDEMIEKDAKRAKDLEIIHRLEENQKIQEKVLAKIREENTILKSTLDNLSSVSDDLANIIDSTIRRVLAKTTKQASKVKVSEITSLIWLSEEQLINYIFLAPLLKERYILDKSRNFILTREHARELIRQAYWKRVGAMHLKKIKQVKVTSLAEDTDINVEVIKEIIKELVERKEIPAPIHMDRISLLLSISDELIGELAEVAQNNAIISINAISQSYDTTPESARVIFQKIAEEGYARGEFINEDTFIVYGLFIKLIVEEGSIKISKIIEEYNLQGLEDDLRILIGKLIQNKDIVGQFITEDIFLCFNNLPEPLQELMETNIEYISKGETRKVVFDIGSIVESITKKQLLLDIHECDEVDKLMSYQEIIESKELGRILRVADDTKITLPTHIELKSLNRFWAQKIKHTKPGEFPYIPTLQETEEFIYEANKILNRMLRQKIPTKWKRTIAEKLLKDQEK